MRIGWLFALLLLASPGLAQDQASLDQWVNNVLTNRAFKMWTPLLYAGPRTAASFGKINGLPVNVDPAMPEGQVAIRNKEDFTIPEMTGPQALQRAGTDMARMQWR